MRGCKHRDLVIEREVEAQARAVAVADCGDLCHATLLQSRKDLAHRRLSDGRAVPTEPRAEVEGGTRLEAVRRGRVGEEVRQDSLEAVKSEVVCEQLIHVLSMSISIGCGERASHEPGCWKAEGQRRPSGRGRPCPLRSLPQAWPRSSRPH